MGNLLPSVCNELFKSTGYVCFPIVTHELDCPFTGFVSRVMRSEWLT